LSCDAIAPAHPRRPGIGTNAFIFPGLGAGAVAVGATRVTDNMVMEAAYALGTPRLAGGFGGGIHWPLERAEYGAGGGENIRPSRPQTSGLRVIWSYFL